MTKTATKTEQMTLKKIIGYRTRKTVRMSTRCGFIEVEANVIVKDEGIIARLEAAKVKLDPVYED